MIKRDGQPAALRSSRSCSEASPAPPTSAKSIRGSSASSPIVSRREVRDAGGELSAARIGELCLEGLRKLDHGAYLQFAGTLPDASRSGS